MDEIKYEFIDPPPNFKPLDFGGDGITGSLDVNGRVIALNTYHPQHGYVTLTVADPFPDEQRYKPAEVRAYRANLANLGGSGFVFDRAVVGRGMQLVQHAIPFLWLTFDDGSEANLTTFVHEGVLIRRWQFENMLPQNWGGRFSLQRSAYTQITEGGPIPAPPIETKLHFENGMMTIENPALGCAVAIAGLPRAEPFAMQNAGAVEILKTGVWQTTDFFVDEAEIKVVYLFYAFGTTADDALNKVKNLTPLWADQALKQTVDRWQHLWQGQSLSKLARRGMVYGLYLTIPVGEGLCYLTDHMLLPLSWNRDAYYVSRALLSWQPEMADIVRRHLIWLFEIAERPNGFWGRCYLANGKIKDHAFQLDQQLFPLLELAEYVEATGDDATLKRLQPHIEPILNMLLARKAPHAMLFPTDETPADDPIALPYHLSSHILLWRLLRKLQDILPHPPPPPRKQGGGENPLSLLAGKGLGIGVELRQAIDHYFIAEHPSTGKKIYAYATDGAGNHHFYHDANDFPLALAPMWGFVSADDAVWRATIEFAFSEANKGGFYDGRLGSVHTPAPWALGDIQDLIIAQALGDENRAEQARDRLNFAAQWDGGLPEAYNAQTGAVVARHWFAWTNAALACVELGAFGEFNV